MLMKSGNFLSHQTLILESWQKFECQAIERKNKGDFDEIFLTQIFPNNYKNFDGTVRPSIFVHITNRLRSRSLLFYVFYQNEVENVVFLRNFIILHRKVMLYYLSVQQNSGQSFVTVDFAISVSKMLIEKVPDLCIILSTNKSFTSPDDCIVDGSILSFRENAN